MCLLHRLVVAVVFRVLVLVFVVVVVVVVVGLGALATCADDAGDGLDRVEGVGLGRDGVL